MSDEMVFAVKEMDTTHGNTLYFEPQFEMGDINDEQKELYRALRKTGAAHYSGVFTVNRVVVTHFEAGETLTADEILGRFKDGIEERRDAVVTATNDLMDTLSRYFEERDDDS